VSIVGETIDHTARMVAAVIVVGAAANTLYDWSVLGQPIFPVTALAVAAIIWFVGRLCRRFL
jgi:hypothetical protein